MTFPYLHEQDATGAEAYTSARWLGWDLEFWIGTECFSSRIGQIWHGAGVFDEFLQGGHERGPSEELTKEVDLSPQLIVWNWFDKFLGGRTSLGVVFRDLRGGRTCDAEGFAFAGQLRHQTHGVCPSCVHRSPREQQIPHKSIAKIALQSRDTSKAGNESQAQFRERKPRHLVGDNHVAGQGQFESSPETGTMHRGDRDKWRGIDRVQHSVDAFEKSAHARGAVFLRHCCRSRIEFAQISTSRKNRLPRASNNTYRSKRCKRAKCRDEFLQFNEHCGANFIGWSMIECQLDDSFAPFPPQCFSGESFHACCLLAASRTLFESYMALISEAYRALMASRRILPLTVSNPFSGENPSRCHQWAVCFRNQCHVRFEESSRSSQQTTRMKTFTGKTLRWEWREGIVELTLDHAPANEIGTAMLLELQKFVSAFRALAPLTSVFILPSPRKPVFSPGGGL